MKRLLSRDNAAIHVAQITDAVPGATVAANKDIHGKWQVKDSAGGDEIAKGVVSNVDGTLRVHLIESYSNGDRTYAHRVYVDIPIIGDGKPCGIGLFDEIDVDNSTSALFTAGNFIVGI